MTPLEQTRFGLALVGLLLLLGTSGMVVWLVLGLASRRSQSDIAEKDKQDTGVIVGKCENILIYVLVLLGAYTAIGLVFAAKSIVRLDDARKQPLFYLAGTLVNVTYSVIVALAFRWALELVKGGVL
jgi:hypothetical protein